MPYLITCIKEYATVGEMTKVFKEVFGEFKEPSIF
jgi:methylmalonyl-CoA mutase N-terminal domain/subunit